MKKNIFKVVIATSFIIIAIVSFNTKAKAIVDPVDWGDVACATADDNCLLCDGSFWPNFEGLGKYCNNLTKSNEL